MKITLTGTKLRQGMDRLRTLDKKKKCFLLFGLLAVILVLTLFIIHKKKEDAASAKAQTVRTAAVTRQDIRSTLSGSGTISPKDTYSITSMADGEVVEADFEEGDEVSEGQVLYRIDASSMESKLKSAGNTLERAQSNYDTAEADYQEALSKYSGNTYKSTKTGYIKTLYIEAGDKVGSNTQIADIYNDNVMKIKIPFLNVEAAQITAGMPAVLTLSDTLEQIEGVVTSVSAMDEALTGGRLIRYVTIEAANPGGLMTSMTATAQIGAFTSSGDGNFTPKVDTVMGADLSSQVDVEQLLVAEGSFVSEGTPIFRMKANSAEKLIKSYKDSLDQAESSLEQAQSSLDTTRDTYDDYTVTAPISGTVITKTVKLGDKIQNGNSATSLAVIYDMSSVTFQMNVDELDIIHVQNGQKVEVVADALQRGNSVYVKDDTVTESQGRVPAGFREVKVETGLISEDYVEIVSGDLEEGDEVSLASTSVPTENDSKNAGMNGMGGMGMPGAMPPGSGSVGSGGENKNWNGGGSGSGNGAPRNRG